MTLRIIGGKFKGRGLKTPKTLSTRPTQSVLRGAIFNICQNEIEGASFLDLFAGSGAMGFEALSRGAKHVTFVESNRRAIACIKENMTALQVASQASLISCDAATALERLSSPFHIVYLDPPYHLSTTPFVERILERNLLVPQALLFIEERFDHQAPSPLFNGKNREEGSLVLVDSRRFGDALLHQYRYS